MAWVRIDDQVPLDPKLLRAGASACWLWVCGLAYAQSHHTDGFIPVEALPMIGVNGVALSRKLAAQLVGAGLFESVEGGFLIHDYLVYNESGAEAKARRDHLTEERRKAGRVGGLISAQRRQEEGQQTASKPQANSRSNVQAPSHPIPSHPIERSSNVLRAAFETFWNTYPRKVGKEPAWKIWQRMKPDSVLQLTILQSLKAHSNSLQWMKDGGEFIPHAKTWLFQRRWQDVLDAKGQVTSNDWSCHHDPLCPPGTTATQCDLRTRLGK